MSLYEDTVLMFDNWIRAAKFVFEMHFLFLFIMCFSIGRSEASEHHMAKISLICNDSLAKNETFFEYINTTNMPTDTYVSVIHLFTL